MGPEPGEPKEGLPPPERPWAKAEAVSARARKAHRKDGVLMAHPQDAFHGSICLLAGVQDTYIAFIVKILQMRIQSGPFGHVLMKVR